MASYPETGRLSPESDILRPLPDVLHHGLAAIAVLACISLVSSAVTLLYLTYKLVRWHIRSRRERYQDGCSPPPTEDFALGLGQRHLRSNGDDVMQARSTVKRKSSPNQFLVLLFNLLIADLFQAAAFLLNAVWLGIDAIQVGSAPCFFQGWLMSNGDLSSSCFISAIAVHTYLTVVWKYKPPQWALYLTIIGIWIFVHSVTVLGIGITKNGESGGGFYVRAAAWCWINVKYENVRLLTHYLWIFISLAITSILYTLIFFHLRRQQHQAQSHSSSALRPSISSKFGSSLDLRAPQATPTAAKAHSGGHHPAFLIYPIIYVVCTAPLALGRIATMAGTSVSLGYFCAAGALICSNGWLDVLLWGVTRRSLLFNAEVDTEESGLETFAFMRTPHDRKYGNMVWVQGGSGRSNTATGTAEHEARGHWSFGWRGVRSGRSSTNLRGSQSHMLGHRLDGTRSISQESLRGAAGRNEMAIHMDLVTSVVVEVDPDKQDSQTREYSLSVNGSIKGSET